MKRILKWMGIVFGGLVVIFIVIGIIAVSTAEEPSAEPMTSTPAKTEVASTASPKPFSAQEVTKETVTVALLPLSGTSIALGDELYRIDVMPHLGTEAPDDFIVHVYFKPESFWDAKNFVKISVHTSIKTMETLFQNRKVSEVVMWGIAEFTDKYGATKDETAIRLLMTRATADRIVNWQGVDDRAWSDYTTFFDLTEVQYIHPAMAKDL